MKKGWRNNYNDKTKWMEVIGKDFKFALNDLLLYFKNGFQLKTILVYPDFPSKKTTIFKIARKLGYRLTNKISVSPAVVIYFEDQTFGKYADSLKLKFPNALNIHCRDISKKMVDRIHLEVFGYNTFIDPIRFSGKAVQKSDINALHDGKVVECPLDEAVEGSVYQILINNQVDDEFVVDYRVAVIGDSIPVCYKKYKRMNVRFTNDVSKSEIGNIDELFSKTEQQSIIQFAKKMNVDFCELDVLRHSDGRIFIIDVNKTPYGPPFGLGENEMAVSLLSTEFENKFL